MEKVVFRLTPREREVAHLVAKGFTAKRIANELGAATRPIDMHIRNIMTKTNSRNRVHMMVLLIVSGTVIIEINDVLIQSTIEVDDYWD